MKLTKTTIEGLKQSKINKVLNGDVIHKSNETRNTTIRKQKGSV